MYNVRNRRNQPLLHPWRKVIYSKLKRGEKRKYFILLECGHVFHNDNVVEVPKKKQCCYCAWGTITIDLIYWEHEAMRWAYVKMCELFKP